MISVNASCVALQVCNSVPGSFGGVDVWPRVIISSCIGIVQAFLGAYVVPQLAQKLTSRKHIYTTLANLLLNCVFPAIVIIGLDTSCLGNWVTLWEPCRHHPEQFMKVYNLQFLGVGTLARQAMWRICDGERTQIVHILQAHPERGPTRKSSS